jgi:hypothetical protein
MKQAVKAVLGCNAIALRHLLRLDLGRFLVASRAAFTASNRAAPRELQLIPEITLDDILGVRRATVRLSIACYEDGMLPSGDAMALLAILVAEGPTEVLEIGTYMGHTTRQMAENLPNSKIHTVDLPEDFRPASKSAGRLPQDDFHLIEKRAVGREFKGAPCAARIVQHFGDTATWDFRAAGRPTFFFIDGAHTYEYCKSDSEKCLALADGPGVFLWHDCDADHPGVVRFVNDWRSVGRDIRRIAGTALAYWKT